MKHKIKEAVIRLSMILILALFLIAGFQIKAEAGFGDFNDYDSGSDWDSGWDSSYDSDWDDDWDNDWDSSWDDGYSRGYSSSRGGSFSYIIVRNIIWIIIVLVIFYAQVKLRKTSAKKRNRTKRQTPARPLPKKLPDRTVEISRMIKERDPLFTAPDFISFAKQVYMDIQDAWAKRDLTPVRAVLHQNLYQQTQRQIQRKLSDGIVNHLERISINTAYLTSYRRDAQYEYLTIYLAASMIDYQVKEATGEVILGDKVTRWNMYYKMTFMRANDAKTRSADEKDKGFVCPNCGAPLTGTSFGKCEYCDSIVTTGIYEWVLSDFGVVKDDTVDDGIVIDS